MIKRGGRQTFRLSPQILSNCWLLSWTLKIGHVDRHFDLLLRSNYMGPQIMSRWTWSGGFRDRIDTPKMAGHATSTGRWVALKRTLCRRERCISGWHWISPVGGGEWWWGPALMLSEEGLTNHPHRPSLHKVGTSWWSYEGGRAGDKRRYEAWLAHIGQTTQSDTSFDTLNKLIPFHSIYSMLTFNF